LVSKTSALNRVQILEVSISVLSNIGGRQRNEDSCGYWKNSDVACCVLSDGAGGHGGGDVASQLAVETVLREFEASPEVSPRKAGELLHLANLAVIQRQSEQAALHDMRATLVLLLYDAQTQKASWGHIGDSRLYVFRDGKELFQTKDHSVFQSMIDAGYVKESPARQSSQRTVLTGSIGGEEGFAPDVPEGLRQVRNGDAYLLCSDGFWEFVDEGEMEATLVLATSSQDWVERLEAVLNQKKKEGNDNYSAIVIWFGTMEFATLIHK
jgi:PPM family protein phosphatase